MRRIGIAVVVFCGTALHVAVAQKAFERVDKFPDGEQGSALGSLVGIKDTNTVTVTLGVPADIAWPAVKAVAQKFDKIGHRPIVAINESSTRIQNGQINLESMATSGGLFAFRDEFVTEVTAVDSSTSTLSVTRKLVKKNLGEWTAHSSNGKVERWIITQVLDEIKTGAALGAGVQMPNSTIYVSQNNPKDFIELRDDKSYWATYAGRQGFGKYEWSGDTLTLTAGKQRVAWHLAGDILTDDEGKPWTRKAQSNPPAAPASVSSAAAPSSNAEVIGNAEIVRLAQAKLPDSVILGRIKNSVCRFDLSTDALIKLKEANVSDAVIQAMAEAPQK